MIFSKMQALLSRKYTGTTEVLILLGVSMLCVLIAFLVFQDYTYSMDEYNYWYQAQIFAQGRLFIDIEPWQESLKETYMVINDGHLFSKYPPGYSALLALGALFNVTGIVTPFISGISALFIFLTIQKAVSRNAAMLVTLLIASNSYFLGYGSSYFAQPSSLMCFAIAFWCYVSYLQNQEKKWIVALGVIGGLSFFVRPLDAFCMLAAIFTSFTLYHRTLNPKRLIQLYLPAIIPVLTAILGFFTYNWFVSGCFCVATYPIWDYEFKVVHSNAIGFTDNIIRVANAYYDSFVRYAVPLFVNRFGPVVGWPFILLIALGCKYAPRHITLACLLSLALLILLYNFHHTIGWPQYGARYWYPALAPLALLVGYAIHALLNRLPNVLMLALYMAVIGLQLARLQSDMESYAGKARGVMRSISVVEEKCPENSVILITPKYGFAVYAPDLIRNPFLNGPRFYADTEKEADSLLKHLPKHYEKCIVSSFRN